MSRLLTLIDFQRHYVFDRPEHKRAVEFVLDMIGYYEANHLPILCITYYDPLGRTLVRDIERALKTAKVIYMDKECTNGSKQVLDGLSHFNLNPCNTTVHIVGAYADQCVDDTVSELALSTKVKRIRVHKNGLIHDLRGLKPSVTLKRLNCYPKVRVV